MVEVARTDLAQHLGLELLTARRHHLLGDLEPLIVDQRRIVDVGVQQVFVEPQQVNDGMCLGHEDKVLPLHIQHAVRFQIVHIELWILKAPRRALARANFVLKHDGGCGVSRFRQTGKRVRRACARALPIRHAGKMDTQAEWKVVFGLEHCHLVQ